MFKAAILFFTYVFLSSAMAQAEQDTLKIKCVSEDGKNQLEGELPKSVSEFKLTAKIKTDQESEELRLFSYVDKEFSTLVENGRVAVVEDLEKGVFTIRAEGINLKSFGIVILYGLPKTIKVQKTGSSLHASFRGELTVYGKKLADDFSVNCNADY